MNFFIQKDDYRCYPIAVYNWFQYFGFKPYTIHQLCKLFKTNKTGTYCHNVSKAIGCKRSRATFNKMKSAKQFLLSVAYRKAQHIMFCYNEGTILNIVGWWDGVKCTHVKVKHSELRKFLKDVTLEGMIL